MALDADIMFPGGLVVWLTGSAGHYIAYSLGEIGHPDVLRLAKALLESLAT